MNAVERRTVRRLIMRVPMRVRGIWEAPQNERGVESMNISIRGTYFASEEKFLVGEKVEVRLKMPEVVVSGQKMEWRFTGRVTHVDKLGTDGKSGVGVYLPLAYCGASFLVTDFLVQNLPDQPTKPMGNRPDSLIVSEARHQTAIHHLEDTSLGFHRRVGSLVENASHGNFSDLR